MFVFFSGDPFPETVDAVKGKEQDRGGASRLCKFALFKRFVVFQ
jgi:hypothetical protein